MTFSTRLSEAEWGEDGRRAIRIYESLRAQGWKDARIFLMALLMLGEGFDFTEERDHHAEMTWHLKNIDARLNALLEILQQHDGDGIIVSSSSGLEKAEEEIEQYQIYYNAANIRHIREFSEDETDEQD